MSALSNISANICVTDMQVRLIEAHLELVRDSSRKIDAMLAAMQREEAELADVRAKLNGRW